MKDLTTCSVLMLCSLYLASAAATDVVTFPFDGTPTNRAVPQLPIDQGDGLIAWIEDFNHPDNTRMFTNLAGNQSQASWFNRPQDIEDFPNDSGYMAIFDNRFFMTGLSEDMLGAPAVFPRDSLLTDLGFGQGSGTTEFSVSFDVNFGSGDWFFVGNLGPWNPGEGEQVGFFDFAIETFNSGNDPLALRPRLICRPAGSFGFNGSDSSGTPSVSAFSIEQRLGKVLNSDDVVRIMLTFDAETGDLEGYVDCIGFLNSRIDTVGGLAGFEDMSRIEIQTGTFLEAGLPGDPFFGEFNYDNLVVTNYVATPEDIVHLIGPIGRDVDGDGILTEADAFTLTACLAGPDELIIPSGCTMQQSEASDHECDIDVDLRDLARLQVTVTNALSSH